MMQELLAFANTKEGKMMILDQFFFGECFTVKILIQK